MSKLFFREIRLNFRNYIVYMIAFIFLFCSELTILNTAFSLKRNFYRAWGSSEFQLQEKYPDLIDLEEEEKKDAVLLLNLVPGITDSEKAEEKDPLSFPLFSSSAAKEEEIPSYNSLVYKGKAYSLSDEDLEKQEEDYSSRGLVEGKDYTVKRMQYNGSLFFQDNDLFYSEYGFEKNGSSSPVIYINSIFSQELQAKKDDKLTIRTAYKSLDLYVGGVFPYSGSDKAFFLSSSVLDLFGYKENTQTVVDLKNLYSYDSLIAFLENRYQLDPEEVKDKLFERYRDAISTISLSLLLVAAMLSILSIYIIWESITNSLQARMRSLCLYNSFGLESKRISFLMVAVNLFYVSVSFFTGMLSYLGVKGVIAKVFESLFCCSFVFCYPYLSFAYYGFLVLLVVLVSFVFYKRRMSLDLSRLLKEEDS